MSIQDLPKEILNKIVWEVTSPKDYGNLLRTASMFYKSFYIENDSLVKYKSFLKKIEKKGKNNTKIVYYVDPKKRKQGEYLEWYSNDQLLKKHVYKNNKLEGKILWWYENGQLGTECFYKNGKLEGENLTWLKDGKLFWNTLYKNGRKID